MLRALGARNPFARAGPPARKEKEADLFCSFYGEIKSGYVCVPGEWKRFMIFLRTIWMFLFAIVDIYAWLLQKATKKKEVKKRVDIRSVGERTTLKRASSLKRRDAGDVLQQWIAGVVLDDDTTCIYESMWQATEAVFFTTALCSYAHRCAKVMLNDSDKRSTCTRLAKSAKLIRGKARKSVKFRYMFKSVMILLDDIEKSTAESRMEFLDTLAIAMLNKNVSWFMEMVHSHLRARTVTQNKYETTLATVSMFLQEGAGLEIYMLNGGWRTGRNSHDAGLTLLLHFAIDSCAGEFRNEINVTEFSGVERILLLKRKQGFVRYVSMYTTKSDWLFKDKLMLDICMNGCNEYVECSWSNDKLGRAVWTLEYGQEYVSKQLYEELESMNGEDGVDLMGFDAICLLTFAMSGMIYFEGCNDCVYKIMGDESAAVKVCGTLPLPSIKDLISLGVLKKLKGGSFEMKKVPGWEKKVKGLRVGDRIHLVETEKNEMFKASLEDKIG